MAQWIEVKVRYDKTMENGLVKKVTDPYLVDALSCTEAEARIIEEVTPFISGEFNVLAVNKTKISEVFWNQRMDADRFYKVKVNYITIDEKTATEKRTASYILVQAANFTDALSRFTEGMKCTFTDYEIEAITETKIVDVYKYQVPGEAQSKSSIVAEATKTITSDKKLQRAAKKFRDTVPDGMKVSAKVMGADGTEIVPETVIVDKSKPKNDDD